MGSSGLITYDSLHGLGRSPGTAVYDKFRALMERYAPGMSPSAGILLDFAGDTDPVLNAAERRLRDWFGPNPDVQRGFHVDGRVFRALRWSIHSSDLDAGLLRVTALRSLGPILLDRLGLQVWWRFKWHDPVTALELPNQDDAPVLDVRRPGPSSIGLSLRAKASAALWLLFPFSDLDRVSTDYIRGFASTLPFTLSGKHWRLWKPNRNGEWRPRKCDPLL